MYTVLYGSFSAYPYIFSAHDLSTSQVGLTFLPVLVGFFLLLILTFIHYRRYTRLALDATKGVERRGIHAGKVEPEERLVPCELALPNRTSQFTRIMTSDPGWEYYILIMTVMSAAILFPAGLFWLAWTSPPKFELWIPLMAGVPFGIGLLAIFQGSMQYMMDAYGPFASSAVSSTVTASNPPRHPSDIDV